MGHSRLRDTDTPIPTRDAAVRSELETIGRWITRRTYQGGKHTKVDNEVALGLLVGYELGERGNVRFTGL